MHRILLSFVVLAACQPLFLMALEPNLFPDLNWENGFSVAAGTQELGKIGIGANEVLNPAWILAEHNSRYNLTEVNPVSISGGMKYETPGNLFQAENDENGERVLTLGVFAENEYEKPRTADEGWPHLLISTNYSDGKEIRLPSEQEKHLWFSADIQITECRSEMKDSEFNPELHCGQVTAYFIIRSADPMSSDRNKYLWLGIPVFDSRYSFPNPSIHIDNNPDGTGTNQLIWVPGGNEALETLYQGKNPRSGEWVHLKADLNKYTAAALADAHKRNLLIHTKLNNLNITHFNLGWEVPGTFHCVMKIKNLSLSYEE